MALQQNSDREKELFAVAEYAQHLMMNEDEAGEFLDEEDNLGVFKIAKTLKASRPNKQKSRDGYTCTPLLLRVPGRYTTVFMDSPLLGVAWQRAHVMIQANLEEEDQHLVAPLMNYLTVGAHSVDGTHSVLMSDWKMVDEDTVSGWMTPQMQMRLAMCSNSNVPQKKDGSNKKKTKKADGKKEKSSSDKRKKKKQKQAGGLFQQFQRSGLAGGADTDAGLAEPRGDGNTFHQIISA